MHAGRFLDVVDNDFLKSLAARHDQRAAAVNDEIDRTRTEIGCGRRHLRQRFVEIIRAPVVDIAGDADQADAVWREAIELVGHDLHHGRADIADAFTPAEHFRFSWFWRSSEIAWLQANHPPMRPFGLLRAATAGLCWIAKAEKSRNVSWEATMPDTVEKSTASKVYWRLLPLAVLTYFLCYLDRINVGFAALTMNKDLGLDAATYGMAAGAFFWGYFLFEVPSNLIREKVGARLWIARIMVSWGLLSGLTAFCTGPWSFLIMRFLLGLAEAGLFPGMILFFTYWFPDWHRARIVSGFMVALPLAVAGGSAVSAGALGLDGLLGLAGWKWMFIAEAVPTVLVGIFILFFVTDRPKDAKWLSADERDWLNSTLETERSLVEAKRKVTFWQSFWDAKVLLLTLNYFGIVGASLGLLLFLS